MDDCIFCKIVRGEVKAKFEYEDNQIVAFADIKPKAPIHILIIPRKHIESIKTLREEEKNLVAEMVWVAKEIAADKNLEGYKLIFNVGILGGQIINHLHLHLLGGWKKAQE